MLGDALRSLLLKHGQEELDTMLPQVKWAHRSVPQISTFDTLNFLMLGREARVPDHLTYDVPDHEKSVHQYVGELVECMRVTHNLLYEKQ